MKKVVSVSIGSSTRDHKVETLILGEKFQVERIGTDGDIEKAIDMIGQLDGKVDAIGMGGIDVYVHGNNKRYILQAGLPLFRAAKITPIVDGSGLKNTLEKHVIKNLSSEGIIDFKNKRVLLVCSMDRVGMAKALVEEGCKTTFGDLIFVLKIPIPIRKLSTIHIIASVLMPIVSRLPFKAIYPTGKSQDIVTTKYVKYYNNADIIAGDFIYIKKYMPERLDGKIIITNTVTQFDVEVLRNRGVKMLVTTTPDLDGRSFGTNVMEAVLITLSGKKPDELTEEDYNDLLNRVGFKPRIERF